VYMYTVGGNITL